MVDKKSYSMNIVTDTRVIIFFTVLGLCMGMTMGYVLSELLDKDIIQEKIVYRNQTVEKDCVAEIVHEDMRVEYLKQKIGNTQYVFEED